MSTVKSKKALIAAAKDFLTANASINTVAGTVSGLPVLDSDQVAYENREFTPDCKNPWASVYYRPNDPDGRTIGQRGYDMLTGFLQIDVNMAAGKGMNILTDWEEKGRIYFHPGRSFVYDTHGVLVTSCGMSAGRHIDNYFRKSLTIAFRSHIKRREVV